jgi:type I restriction enzyme S subunit
MDYVTPEKFTELARHSFRLGDIVITKLGDPLGVAAVVNDIDAGLIVADLVRIRTDESRVDTRYLAYAINSPGIRMWLNGKQKGSTRPRVSLLLVREMPIPLPPLDEQKRIVAKLDEAMEESDRCLDYHQVQIDQAENLYQAAIRTIIESLNSELVAFRLGDIALKIGSGATPKGGANAYVESGISLIRSLNIHDSDFRLKNLAFITEEQAQKLQNVVVEKNDVLLNITGASIARTCVVDESILPARVNQHVAIIRSDTTKVYPEYLGLMLVSKATKDRLLNIGDAAGTTRQALTKAELENFEIRIPQDISEQVLRCRKAAEVFDLVTELKRNLNTRRNLMENFKASILSTAFAGAL